MHARADPNLLAAGDSVDPKWVDFTLDATVDKLPDVQTFTQTLDCKTSPVCTNPAANPEDNKLDNTATVTWVGAGGSPLEDSDDASAGPINCECGIPSVNVTAGSTYTLQYIWCAAAAVGL